MSQRVESDKSRRVLPDCHHRARSLHFLMSDAECGIECLRIDGLQPRRCLKKLPRNPNFRQSTKGVLCARKCSELTCWKASLENSKCWANKVVYFQKFGVANRRYHQWNCWHQKRLNNIGWFSWIELKHKRLCSYVHKFPCRFQLCLCSPRLSAVLSTQKFD